MNNRIKSQITLLAAAVLFLGGCATGRINIVEQPRAEALEPIKTTNAAVPVRVQVADFVVNSVQQNSENTDTESLRRFFVLRVPRKLYESLGNRHVFTEVSRASAPNPSSADFVLTGDYDFTCINGRGLGTHYSSFKGTMHVRVVDAKTGVRVFEKTYVEEHRDEASLRTETRVEWLQPGHIAEITSDIKKAIYEKMGKSQ